MRNHAEKIASALEYNPDTGLFTWRRSYGSNIYPGAPAPGTIKKDGERVLTVYGVPYLAKRLAWFLAYNHWPTHPITYRSLLTARTPEEKRAARADLRLSNLCIYSKPLARNSRAGYMRDYRAKQKAERLAAEAKAAKVIDGYETIAWSETHNAFCVQEDIHVAKALTKKDRNYVIGYTRDRIEAVEMFNEHNDRCLYVLNNPPPALTPAEAALTTGKGHTLEELTQYMAYNPETGDFLARHGTLAGHRIDRPKNPVGDPQGTRVVPYKADTYYARNLAWFMHYWRWPEPYEITYADPMFRDDNRIANIITRTEKEKRETAVYADDIAQDQVRAERDAARHEAKLARNRARYHARRNAETETPKG